MPDPALQELRHLAAELRLPVAVVRSLLDAAGVLPASEREGKPLYDRLSVAQIRHELNKRPRTKHPAKTAQDQ